jgi:hypothetical protein
MYKLPPGLQERFEKLLNDPDATNLKKEIEMLEQLQARLAASESPDAKAVVTIRKNLEKLRKTQEKLDKK